MEESRKEFVSVPVNLAFCVAAFLVADRVIGSRTMRELFVRANLFGKDLNKTSEERV